MWSHLSFFVQASFYLLVQSSLSQISSDFWLDFLFLLGFMGYSQYLHFLLIVKGLLLSFGDFMLFTSLPDMKWGNLAGFTLFGLAWWTEESEVGKILFIKIVKRFSIFVAKSITDFTLDELKLVFAWDTSD